MSGVMVDLVAVILSGLRPHADAYHLELQQDTDDTMVPKHVGV